MRRPGIFPVTTPHYAGGGGGGGPPLCDGNPANVDAGPASPGISTDASRCDHKHDTSVAIAVSVGAANAEGVLDTLSRSDHVHDASVLPTQQASLTFNNFPIVGQSYTFLSDTIAATANNYSPAGPPAFPIVDVVRITLTGNQTMTGMAAPGATENKKKILENVDATEKLTLTHLDGGSLAANQFSLPQGIPIVVGPGESIEFVYDPTSTKWRPVANTGQLADAVWATFHQEFNNGTASADTIAFQTDGQYQRITLNGSGTLTLQFPGIGTYRLKVIQDGTGGWTPTLAVGTGVVRKPGGLLVFTAAANAVDILNLYYDGTDVWATLVPNFLS